MKAIGALQGHLGVGQREHFMPMLTKASTSYLYNRKGKRDAFVVFEKVCLLRRLCVIAVRFSSSNNFSRDENSFISLRS
jgi:hypothetical protein